MALIAHCVENIVAQWFYAELVAYGQPQDGDGLRTYHRILHEYAKDVRPFYRRMALELQLCGPDRFVSGWDFLCQQASAEGLAAVRRALDDVYGDAFTRAYGSQHDRPRGAPN